MQEVSNFTATSIPLPFSEEPLGPFLHLATNAVANPSDMPYTSRCSSGFAVALCFGQRQACNIRSTRTGWPTWMSTTPSSSKHWKSSLPLFQARGLLPGPLRAKVSEFLIPQAEVWEHYVGLEIVADNDPALALAQPMQGVILLASWRNSRTRYARSRGRRHSDSAVAQSEVRLPHSNRRQLKGSMTRIWDQ